MGILKIIFIILLIYYGFKIIARLFAPFLIKKMVDKMQQKTNQQFSNNKEEPSVKVGETVIDKKPQQTQQNRKDVGEYVDFEEVD